jgi:hypothetical protein
MLSRVWTAPATWGSTLSFTEVTSMLSFTELRCLLVSGITASFIFITLLKKQKKIFKF